MEVNEAYKHKNWGDRLAKIDPLELQAGPETDALVTEILSSPELFGTNALRHPVPRGAFSTDANLAFSVLSPWLKRHATWIQKLPGGRERELNPWLSKDRKRHYSILWHGPPGEGDKTCSTFYIVADTRALVLCRAVIAVAGRKAGVELEPGWKKWNSDLRKKLSKAEEERRGTLTSL